MAAVGPPAWLFGPGHVIYYAGAIQKPGSNAQLQLVDERIVGATPASLDWGAAAALPLTAITAYEAIVDRLGADPETVERGSTPIMIAGAGGVGSMAIQSGCVLGLDVVATASRPESTEWCRALGASAVIDQRAPLADGLRAAGYHLVDRVPIYAHPDHYWPQLVGPIRRQGAICLIVANRMPIDLKAVLRKCARFCWEAMFARSNFDTPDMIE